MRVIVGVRETSELRQVARRLRAAGASIERLPELSAVASRGVSAAFVVELLRGDPAVTFIEEDRELAVLADPYDATDPATGLNYNWAYDAIAAGPAIAAVGGGSQFSVAVVDTGVDVSHADLAGRVVGSYSALDGGTDATDSLGHGTFVAGLISAIDGNALSAARARRARRICWPCKASSSGRRVL